jgi:glucokinase
MKAGVVIAVDLGGTNLRLGAIDAAGRVLVRARARMGPHRRKRTLLEEICSRIRHFEREARACGRIEAVSLGFAGYTDAERGLIYFAPNLGGLGNIDVGPYLGKRLELPVFVDNDANCAAIGEYFKGAGRSVHSLFVFTLGTGVGGGFVVKGDIWRGAHGTAGEIGHTIVMAGGPRCTCGNRGCLEAFTSATAIVREYRRRKRGRGAGVRVKPAGKAGRGKAGVLGATAGELTARRVADLARHGDRAALGALDYAAKGLGIGIANIFNLLDPELILIGGGVSRAGSVLLKPAIQEARSIIYPPLAPRLRVKRAALGDDAALIGAARLAFAALKNR